MISAFTLFLSNITATRIRNFVTYFRNFTEAKLYYTLNSYWYVLKMKCLQKKQKWIPEMDP